MRRSLLLIPLAFVLMTPAFVHGSGWTHSQIYNFVWTKQVGAAFASGHIYPRWLPDSFEGLGSPTFFFYPPLAFWLSGALAATGLTTLQAINATGFLLLLASGLAMYAWLAWRGGRALLGAALYMLAPYHLTDFYTRGALAEFAAFVWIPLVALGVEALPKRWGWALLATAYAGLILAHLPAAMLTGVFLVAPLLLWRARSEPAVLAPAASALLVALALAAFYLLPALTLQEQISDRLLWSSYYQAERWTVWRTQSVLYLASIPPIAVGMALLAAMSRSRWTVIAVIAGVAALGLVPVLWTLPVLDRVQFPWRLLCIVEFAAVTALALRPPPPLLAALGGVVLALPYAVQVFQTQAAFHRQVDYALLERTMPDAPEYLPKGFNVSQISDLNRLVDLAPYRGLPSAPVLRVTKTRRVTLHHAAFPIWKVFRDDREVPTTGPLITFEATPGVYRLKRVTLWQERMGAFISLAGIALLTSGLLGGGHKVRWRYGLSPRPSGSGRGSPSPTNCSDTELMQ